MNLNTLFVEQCNIVPGVPGDQAGASGISTPYVSLKNHFRATLVYISAAGAANEDPVITLNQATAVAGTSEKVANVISIAHKKTGADLTAIGLFTAVTQTADEQVTAEGSEQKCWVIDVKAESLDRANGFDCVKASIADTGATASVGVLFWILWGSRYAGAGMVSPIAD